MEVTFSRKHGRESWRGRRFSPFCIIFYPVGRFRHSCWNQASSRSIPPFFQDMKALNLSWNPAPGREDSISQWAPLGFPVTQWWRICLPVRETWVPLAGEGPLEEEMAPHSSMLAWRIPWTEEPGGQQSTGSQRVGHHWKIECAHPYRIKVGTVPDQEIQQEVNSVGQPLEGKWASRALPGICIFGAAGGISQWTCRVCEGCIDIPLE